MDKEILKSDEGLVQIVKCPRCLYMVKQSDIVWRRQPNDFKEEGEAERCRFDDMDSSAPETTSAEA